MAQVRFEGVWKTYGKTQAVKGLSLEIQDGEFMALLGPSGCGKTSTLRMVAGLEEVSAGDIYFNDRQVTRMRPAERNVAMAFEHYALYPSLTVRDNIAFPLVARGYSKSEIKRRVQTLLEALEIEHIADMKPSKLSDGQKQRVGLARALVREPVVFLLDEPLSHLDARQRARMRTFLKRLHQEIKTTMIMVTHDQVEALAMADRVAVMNEGKLEQVSDPVELYEAPKTQFVAGFIGEPPMNLLPCELYVDGGRILLRGEGFSVTFPESARLADGTRNGDAVVLGVRPEDLEICDSDGGESNGVFFGTTQLVEDLGDEVVVTIGLDGEKIHMVLEPGAMRPDEGSPVAIRPKTERIRVFSVETGLSLMA
ncbi:MAG: ABC transporter ATP-binding protein [Firmicutes bacterium]|jgi:ABC-type sugar transport system ATPase subunit|nr:ABC transporter ATP-binding protein [Bacillota bacterium]MDH7494815.1 ABC transporter ATP-binding protein [Bacillota bacterium]